MIYALPILLLIFTILAFFCLGRGHFASFGTPQLLLRVFVALPLLISGILLHFLRTDASASIIPPSFPARHFLVLLTGILEIAGAIGLFVPDYRRSAAFWIALMMWRSSPPMSTQPEKLWAVFQCPQFLFALLCRSFTSFWYCSQDMEYRGGFASPNFRIDLRNKASPAFSQFANHHTTCKRTQESDRFAIRTAQLK